MNLKLWYGIALLDTGLLFTSFNEKKNVYNAAYHLSGKEN